MLSLDRSKDQFLIYIYIYIYTLCSSSTPNNTLFTFLLLENAHPPFLGDSLPFISPFLASQPSSCMPLGIPKDTCPLKNSAENGGKDC